MGFKSLLKRPAFIAFLVVLILLILVVIRIHTYAWPWLASKPHAEVEAYEAQWSMAVAVDIRGNFETICLTHANALLAAEKRLAAGQEVGQILKDLAALPGVKASIMDELDGNIYQYPDGAYQVKDVQPQFKHFEKEATAYVHPILRRKVSGLTRFVKWPAGNDSLDILVRYAEAPGAEKKVLGLVIDKKWILDQVPAFMDSLAREDPLVLFWSVPKKDLAEQTIGITYEGDTLWWDNNRGLPTIYHWQDSGLIKGLNIHVRYHQIWTEKEVAEQMPGIRRWFASVEILGIVALVLALFAIRPRKQDKS